jgi:hypothetical protein
MVHPNCSSSSSITAHRWQPQFSLKVGTRWQRILYTIKIVMANQGVGPESCDCS